MRVLIVAKTRMRNGLICVGAHDLDNSFRSLRLFPTDNTRYADDAPFAIGDVFDLDYREQPGGRHPHVEDVTVTRIGERLARGKNIPRLVYANDTVWESIDDLFEGKLEFTASGTAYIPVGGDLPSRSTGYWSPGTTLRRMRFDSTVRYVLDGDPNLKQIRYLGLEGAAERIPAGALVRLSLSGNWQPPNLPDGYWLQLSGWYEAD
jgi:hypothetical protein